MTISFFVKFYGSGNYMRVFDLGQGENTNNLLFTLNGTT